MSNTRRARPRRVNGSRFHDMWDDQIALVAGWADTDHVDDAKKTTHDTLIALLGNNRTGGVSWRLVDNVNEALALLVRMGEGASQAHLDNYSTISDLLREHGGVLVIATAPGRPPTDHPRPT